VLLASYKNFQPQAMLAGRHFNLGQLLVVARLQRPNTK